MKVIVGGMAAILLLTAGQAQAQRTTVDDVAVEIERAVERSGVLAAIDDLVQATAPELERTLEHLARTLEALASRVAEDPEVRRSAARAAVGVVEIAEVVVLEQTEAILEALREAAERMARAARR
jgi:hypothetical protein